MDQFFSNDGCKHSFILLVFLKNGIFKPIFLKCCDFVVIKREPCRTPKREDKTDEKIYVKSYPRGNRGKSCFSSPLIKQPPCSVREGGNVNFTLHCMWQGTPNGSIPKNRTKFEQYAKWNWPLHIMHFAPLKRTPLSKYIQEQETSFTFWVREDLLSHPGTVRLSARPKI